MSSKYTRPDMLKEKNPRWNGGCSVHPEYMNYRNMIRRGRLTEGTYASVSVCKRWQESFWNFLQDMGAKPIDGRWTVERINNDGNYEPSNCRWATASDQMRNRSTIHFSEQAKDNIRQGALGNTNKAGKYKVAGQPSRTTQYRIKQRNMMYTNKHKEF